MPNNEGTLVYIDTNIIYGYACELAREYIDNKEIKRVGKIKKKKTKIKTDNILDNLIKCNYDFITSRLTNFEVITKLRIENSIPNEIGRKILNEIIDKYKIIYCRRKEFKFSYDFFNLILKEKLRLRDGLHIDYARKPHSKTMLKLLILTGDKQMLKAKNVYPLIKNPNELIERYFKKLKKN